MKDHIMAISEEEVIKLMSGYLSGELDENRLKVLMDWIVESPENKSFFDEVCTEFKRKRRWELYRKIDTKAAVRKFDLATSSSFRESFNYLRWGWVAAIAILFIGGGILFIFSEAQKRPLPEIMKAEIHPGSSNALLVLANGREIQLEGKDSLEVNTVEGTQIISKNQQLIYNVKTPSSFCEYNELRTPRGGEYRVILSDGTSVRLNSGSTLKYPVVFSGNVREVEVTGEALFEVAKDVIPFQVKVKNMTVKVYGTIFNINAHSSDQIQTALAEGRVGIRVEGKHVEYLLEPSQLAEFNVNTLEMDICQTDITPYLAWTKGIFAFENQSLEDIMETLSLWYDVDVLFQDQTLPNLHFTGSVERYENITTILNALSLSVGVKFNQQGKILVISN